MGSGRAVGAALSPYLLCGILAIALVYPAFRGARTQAQHQLQMQQGLQPGMPTDPWGAGGNAQDTQRQMDEQMRQMREDMERQMERTRQNQPPGFPGGCGSPPGR